MPVPNFDGAAAEPQKTARNATKQDGDRRRASSRGMSAIKRAAAKSKVGALRSQQTATAVAFSQKTYRIDR